MINEPVQKRAAPGADPVEWWQVDREILECLATHGAMTPGEICRELGLSEGEATSLLATLAQEGRVQICQVVACSVWEPWGVDIGAGGIGCKQ